MHIYRSFIISGLVYCLFFSFSTQAQTIFPTDNALTIQVPPMAKKQSSYVLELRYTYKPPSKSIPARASSHDTTTEIHVMPNIFSLSVKTSNIEYQYTVVMQHGTHSLYLYPLMFEGEILSITIEIPQALREVFGSIQDAINAYIYARSITTVQNMWGGALPLSMDDMLNWKGSNYTNIGNGDTDVFRWSAHPSAVVMVFRSHTVQAKYLKRLAFFVEKKHTRGTLLSETALQARKGWGAHDYKADDLAHFFETARIQNIALNPQEHTLKKLLLQLGILQYKKTSAQKNDIATSAVKTGIGTLSTISRSYSKQLQKTLLIHELLHAWFFTDALLRDTVQEIWMQKSKALKTAWRNFLSRKGYDSNFEYLVQNEFFAYLLQRSEKTLPQYVSSWFAYTPVEQRRMFLKEIQSAIEKLEAYIRKTYNAQAGFVQYRF